MSGTIVRGSAATPADAAIRVLVASPDAGLRMQIRRLTAAASDIAVVGSSRLGAPLEEAISREKPTLLLLDASVDPEAALLAVRSAGLQALKVVVLHGPKRLDAGGLAIAAQLAYPNLVESGEAESKFARLLLATLRAAAPRATPAAPLLNTGAPAPGALSSQAVAGAAGIATPRLRGRPDIVAFGSSTGGPQALAQVVKRLGTGISQPMILTQHMPPYFTGMLAEQISRNGMPAVEAPAGMPLQPGRLHIAPGGWHLLLVRQGEQLVCQLDDGPPENFCRPSVDPMLRSAVRICGGRILAVILTGMGSDGLASCRELAGVGGTVLAQDEATSVVWGMPGAVAQAGLCHAILPLDSMADAILTLAAGRPL